MEKKNNSGILFKVNQKKSPNGPDYEGKIVIDGIEKRLAGWVKESATGNKFLSVSISEPFKKDDKPKKVVEKTVPLEEIVGDDLPF